MFSFDQIYYKRTSMRMPRGKFHQTQSLIPLFFKLDNWIFVFLHSIFIKLFKKFIQFVLCNFSIYIFTKYNIFPVIVVNYERFFNIYLPVKINKGSKYTLVVGLELSHSSDHKNSLSSSDFSEGTQFSSGT